jgi:hypothetical protein
MFNCFFRPPFCRYSFFFFCYVMMVLIFLKGILFDLLLIRSHLISDQVYFGFCFPCENQEPRK